MAAAVSLAFGAALALGIVSTWMLFAFTMLMGASNVMDRPARFTTAFELVPRELAVKAVALNTIGFSRRACSARRWRATSSPRSAAQAASSSRACSTPPRGDGAHGGLPGARARKQERSLGDGSKACASRFRIRAPACCSRRLAAVFPADPGLRHALSDLKDEFAAGPTGLGLLLTAVGVGGTLGGFIANALGRAERQGLLQAVWVVVMAASIIGVALSPTLAVAIVFSVVGGAAEMAHASSNMAMLQIAAPEEMRGRISALLMLNPAFISIGALVAGRCPTRSACATPPPFRGHGGRRRAVLYASSSSLRELRHK